MAALDLLSGNADEPKYSWWVGASDEDKEEHWVWKGDDSTKNVTESSWFFFGRGLPDKPEIKYNEFGDDDCSMILDKENFLRYFFLSINIAKMNNL